ncbi:MAG: rod shape-determining protein RodA [Terrisporobacter sp.]
MVNYKNTIKLLKQLDWKLIITLLAIFIYGLVILSSATHANQTGSYSRLIKQSLAFTIGIVMVIFILMCDYNFIGNYYKGLYVISIFLLSVVLIPGVGEIRGGARSTIDLGPLDLQVAEIVKLTFILSYAKIVEMKKGKLDNLKDIMKLLMYAAPIIGLLIAQPDLGTAIVFCCIIAGIIFTAGIDYKILRKAILAVVVLMPIVYLCIDPYQQSRITGFLNPEDTSIQGNYQVMQSNIAIGSGGLTGKGLYQGTQNQEDFLPIQDSDFIFAVVGEELGVLGMVALIGLFAYFLFRMLIIASESKDEYGTLVVVGVASMFAYQIIQNIGMTVSLIPVTGVTLPFVSYGGSSVLTSMANLGIVLNVCMRRKKINF